jgi:hypothetical protein
VYREYRRPGGAVYDSDAARISNRQSRITGIPDIFPETIASPLAEDIK